MLFVYSNASSSPIIQSGNDSIQIWSSSNLHNLTQTWLSEYIKINQVAKVNISSVQAANLPDFMNAAENIGFITKDQLSEMSPKPYWSLAVARDIIVPVMNPKNPFRAEICSKGISPADFESVYSNSGKLSWNFLLDNNQTNTVNCYFINDESTKISLSKFMQTDMSKISGKAVSNLDEMLRNIQNDKYAIGFCKLVDIMDFESQEINKNIMLIPIDVNGNNQIDYFEDIYKNSSAFTRGIWIGKYPRTLYNSVYAVANNRPAKNQELDLLKWVLTDGQQYLHTIGYSELISSERQPKIQALFANQIQQIDVNYKSTLATTILYVLLLSFIVFLFIYFIFRGRNLRAKDIVKSISSSPPIFSENTVLAPLGLYFDKSHTWAFMESDGSVRVGIDDFLQHITGPITKVKMKNQGERIKKGDALFSIMQHGKQLCIYSPISGTIIENNLMLNNDSSIINSSPYAEGWVYKIESNNWMKEIKTFLMGDSYRAWLKNEFLRIKEFLISTVKPEEAYRLQLVMQDGGELVDNLLENLGPETWEEFQSVLYKRI